MMFYKNKQFENTLKMANDLEKKERDIINSVESMVTFLNKNGMRYDRIEYFIIKITKDSIKRIETKIDREYLK